MRTSRTAQVVTPWVLVGAILACAIVTAAGFVMGDASVAISGAVIVVVAALALMILPRLGVCDRVSFAVDFPNSTRGPRGAVHDSPFAPVDSDPRRRHYRDWPRFHTMDEVITGVLPDGPDEEPAWPQYVNLAPGQRVRTIHGHEFIERDPEPPPIQQPMAEEHRKA